MKKIESGNSANLTNRGRGRPKGKPNKATTEFRETISALLSNNSENVEKWLKSVADGDPTVGIKPDPYRALDLMAKLAEYAAPKLSRTEHTGDSDKPIELKVSWAK
jgi:hypothetical protein